MKWQDKLAVMKLEGFDVRQSIGWTKGDMTCWRYICEVDDENTIYGTGDTKAQAVNQAWRTYMEHLNAKAS